MLKRTDFGSCHENVPKQILREREVNGDAIRLYDELQKEVRKVRKKLETDLLPYLEKKHDREEKGLLIGRKMDLHALYRPDGKLFEKKQLPGQDSDTVIALLIDLSGSMRVGGRIEQARFAALCLYEFCKEADIPVAVYGHHTGLVLCDDREMPRKETVCLRSLAEFDSVDGMDAYRILDAEAKGSNRDGAAIRFMGEGKRMKIRTQNGKIVELTNFGIRDGGIKDNHGVWGVVGREPDPVYQRGKDWTLGIYGDKLTAFRILSMISQHEGDEPFAMPPEDTVMDL
ncbi:MAG: hypothetical protein LUF35_11760 [Lachnospiraceae bacterium]|nr:hypothetical protein [Lachnospiraceae bacterium]